MKNKLLLLHGALGSKAQFERFEQELSDEFEIYSFSFDGHGGIESDEEFSIQLFSSNVIDFLDKLGIDKINVFGYSMGGYVALYTALNHPSRIQEILTLGTKFEWDEASAEKEVKMLNPEIISVKVPKFAESLERMHHPVDWKENMNKTAQMMLNMGKGAKISDELFKDLNIKVTIGIGDQDHMVSIDESVKYSSMIPNASCVTLKAVKHPIDLVEKEVVLNFIRSCFK